MKKSILYISVLILLSFCSCQRPFNNAYPGGTMEYPERAITQRASSYDLNWENGNGDARRIDPGEDWYIDWEKRAVPKDVPYFHARYRQENPVQVGQDYLVGDFEKRNTN